MADLQDERYFNINFLLQQLFEENPKYLDRLITLLKKSKYLNKISENKEDYPGASALTMLAGTPKGLQILKKDKQLRNLISDIGLDASISEGPDAGLTTTFFLISNRDGIEILQEDKELRSKITEKGLNSVMKGGQSGVYFLLQFPEGQKLLLEDKELRSKITKEGLNRPLLEGPDKGWTAIYKLANTTEGRQLLREDKELRSKITEEGLNSRSEDGMSAAIVIANEIDLFIEDNELRSKITKEGLNKEVLKGPSKGLTVLFRFANTTEGRQLLHEDKELRSKITEEGLNSLANDGTSVAVLLATNDIRLFIDDELRSKITKEILNTRVLNGSNQGLTVLFGFTQNEQGLQLLREDKELRSKITKEGLNTVYQGENKKNIGISPIYHLCQYEQGQKILSEDKSLLELIDIPLLMKPVVFYKNKSPHDFLNETDIGKQILKYLEPKTAAWKKNNSTLLQSQSVFQGAAPGRSTVETKATDKPQGPNAPK